MRLHPVRRPSSPLVLSRAEVLVGDCGCRAGGGRTSLARGAQPALEMGLALLRYANSPACSASGSLKRLTGRSGCRQRLQWRPPQSGSGIGVPAGVPVLPNAQDAVGAGLVEAGDTAHLGRPAEPPRRSAPPPPILLVETALRPLTASQRAAVAGECNGWGRSRSPHLGRPSAPSTARTSGNSCSCTSAGLAGRLPSGRLLRCVRREIDGDGRDLPDPEVPPMRTCTRCGRRSCPAWLCHPSCGGA